MGLREAIDEDLAHLEPWLSWTLEEPATLERTRARLRGWVEEFQAGRSVRYAIAPLDRPSLILGGAHLKQHAAASVREVGYWVRKSAARQGIAGAAVSTLAVQAFEEDGVDRLVLQCDVANDASAAFARSLGFRLVGGVTRTYPDGAPRPVLEFEMSRDGYRLHHAATLGERSRRVRLVADAPTPPRGPRGRPAEPEHHQ